MQEFLLLVTWLASNQPFSHYQVQFSSNEKCEAARQQLIKDAERIGQAMIERAISEPFHIFAVEASMVTDTPDEYKKRIAALAEKYLKAAKDAATAASVPCDVVHVENEHPYEAIIDTARKSGCDAIVMASHGRRGVSAVVLGSETVKVLTHSTTPVVVVRR